MAWTNLDDVYVSANGGTIAGDLKVNGTLTINDKKGTNTTYDVASQITSLRDSVSQCKIQLNNCRLYTGRFNIKSGATGWIRLWDCDTFKSTFNTSNPNLAYVSVCNRNAGSSSIWPGPPICDGNGDWWSFISIVNNGYPYRCTDVTVPITYLVITF